MTPQAFSSLDKIMVKHETARSEELRLRPASPWSEAERSKEAVERRLDATRKDFWAFDKLYFPKEMYPQGKAAPAKFHKDVAQITMTPGVNVILGPRDHGKTATVKKVICWLMLTGQKSLLAWYSETMPKSSSAIDDIASLACENERILHDYKPVVVQRNSNQFSLRTSYGRSTIGAFSEGRSLRGYVQGFARPEVLICDDVETKQSAFTREAVRQRGEKLREAVGSLVNGALTVILANNFEKQSLTNSLLEEQNNGVLPHGWKVHVYKAWNKGRALWPQRYKARTEEGLKAEVGAADETDWQGNFQQNPIPPEGMVFTRDYLEFWDNLPPDAKGVQYCDPNLALKAKGDTTAIVNLYYSAKTELYYVSARCRSFADPSELLSAALDMRSDRIRGMGFDGHVNQESHWTHHIRAWCQKHRRPYPSIEFKRYNVDELATNFQAVYKQGKVRFDPALKASDDGTVFFQQFFAFISKKMKRKDDAPDALISAYQFIHERRLVRRVSGGRAPVSIVIKDVY